MNVIDSKKIDYFTIYDSPGYDACWGIAKASGKIYIPICQEFVPGAVGQIYSFDIDKEIFEHIVDLSIVTGDDPKEGRAPQGKAHFSLCPASDLKIYAATHATPPPIGTPFQFDPFAIMNDGYRYFKGSHLFYYDSVSGETTDFGVIVPHQGVGTMILDENVERFFGITYPLGHLFTCDMKGRDLIDLGKVSENYLLCIIKYDDETIYFTSSDGRLVSVNPKNFKVTFTDIILPNSSRENKIAYMSMADSVLGPDGKVYCTLYGHTNICRFWPEKGKIIVEDMGYPYDEEVDANFTRPRALVFDKSGNLYYIVVKKYESYMVSLNIEDNCKKNYGAIIKDGIKGTGWRMVIDDKGRIYFADVGQIPVNLWRFNPNK